MQRGLRRTLRQTASHKQGTPLGRHKSERPVGGADSHLLPPVLATNSQDSLRITGRAVPGAIDDRRKVWHRAIYA